MRNIIASLYKNPIVHTVDIIDIIEEPEIQLLYVSKDSLVWRSSFSFFLSIL